MTRRIDSGSRKKLQDWEDLVLYSYDDADPNRVKKWIKPGDKVMGTLTIGFGHTGPDVLPGQRITIAEAHTLLTNDLDPCERAVDTLVKVPLNNSQFAALVIFTLNVGVRAFTNSTLLKRLNKGEYSAVPYELMRWNKTTINKKKVVSNGLISRRNKEIGLWSSADEVVAPSSTHAEPLKKPLVTKESITFGTGIVATLTAGGTTIYNGAGPIQYAIAVVILAAFGTGLYLFLKKRI